MSVWTQNYITGLVTSSTVSSCSKHTKERCTNISMPITKLVNTFPIVARTTVNKISWLELWLGAAWYDWEDGEDPAREILQVDIDFFSTGVHLI